MPPQQRPLIRVGNRMVPGPPVVNANLRSLLDPNADITIAPETFQANVSALQPAVAQEPDVPRPKILDLVSQLFSDTKEWVDDKGLLSVAQTLAKGAVDYEMDRGRAVVDAVQNAPQRMAEAAVNFGRDAVQEARDTGGLSVLNAVDQGLSGITGNQTIVDKVYPELQNSRTGQRAALVGTVLGMALPMPGGKLKAAAKATTKAVDVAGDLARVPAGSRKNVGGRGAEVAAAANARLKAGRVETPIRAYHGSPHDFDQFSLSKIGTGEGAQAYGHGLYFADQEKVAKGYADALAKAQGSPLVIRKGGQVYKQGDDLTGEVLDAYKYLEMGAKDAGEFPHNRFYYAKKGVEQMPEGPYRDRVMATLEDLKDTTAAYEKPKGRMYEVNLHTDLDALLDWDGPIPAGLQKQLGVRGTIKSGKELYTALHNKAVHASGVHKGYKQPGLSDPDGLGELADRVGVDLTPAQPGSYDESDFGRIRSEFENRRKDFTRTEWTKIQAMLDDDADATASTLLRESGVPGLKYFDANSRPMSRPHGVELVNDDGRVVNTFQFSSKAEAEKAIPDLEKQNAKLGYPSRGRYVDSSGPRGEGTRNYVIWETKVIDLLRKYGILPPLAAASAHESRGAKEAVEQTPEPAPISNVNLNLSGLGQITPPADPSRIDVAALQAANAKRDPLVLQTSTSDRPMSSDDLLKTWINTGPLGIVRGMRQVGEADLARSRGETDANAYYRGGTEMLRGAGVSALPLMGPAMGAASMTGVGAARLGAALVAGPFIAEGASKATEALGGSTDAQDLAREVGYFADPTHMGAAVKAGVLGAAVMGGIRKAESSVLKGLNVGGRGAEVAAAANAKLAAGRVVTPIRAYHGSPHDFDQFSLSKIGTGEGVQAYGHGLYFAENPQVAKTYRDNLSKAQSSPLNDAAKHWIAQAGGDKKKAVELMREYTEASGPVGKKAQEIDELAQAIEHGEKAGRMYEVEINAATEDLLDWDAPLSQQNEKVQQAVRNLKKRLDSFTEPEQRATKSWSDQVDNGTLRGEDIYTALGGGDKRKATEALRQAGIPGIKYLDGASRGTGGGELIDTFQKDGKWFAKIRKTNVSGGIGNTPADMFTTSMPLPSQAAAKQWADKQIMQGTRNYVVWDETRIALLRKYGILPPLAAATAYESTRRGTKEKDQ